MVLGVMDFAMQQSQETDPLCSMSIAAAIIRSAIVKIAQMHLFAMEHTGLYAIYLN